jgi:hypothetical protein
LVKVADQLVTVTDSIPFPEVAVAGMVAVQVTPQVVDLAMLVVC